METIYDWVTVAIFAGLVVLFLQRSNSDRPPVDSLPQYLGASVGCMVGNYFGNHAISEGNILYHFLGVAVIVGTLAYVQIALRPFDKPAE